MSEKNKEKFADAENEKPEVVENGEIVSAQKLNRSCKPMYIALAVVGIVVFGALIIWLFRSSSREGGQLVPAPRTISFEPGGSNGEQTSAPAEEQIITLAPEQIERAGIKIEQVGETLSNEAAQIAATGVVQPNAYSETPVISLVGGVVRKVTAQLGESAGKGQTVAVVSSDELGGHSHDFTLCKLRRKRRGKLRNAPLNY